MLEDEERQKIKQVFVTVLFYILLDYFSAFLKHLATLVRG